MSDNRVSEPSVCLDAFNIALTENFGLPVLEAMLLGAPVVGSTGGAMPEVAAAAALLVAPYDDWAMRGAIRFLDPGLSAELSVRGRKPAGMFSPAHHSG